MTLLDRYLGGRLLAMLFKITGALVLIFILIDLLTQRRAVILRNDVPWNVVLEYYLTYTPQILVKYQIAGLAMLVSGLLVLGEAAQNNEVTAALAGGISLSRLARTPVLIAVGLAVALFFFQDTIGVVATRQANQLEARYFSKKGQSKRTGVSWPHLAGDWTCHTLKFNRLALTGENVLMHSTRPDAVEQILARRIFWDPDVRKWFIEDGRWLVLDPQKDWQGPVNRVTLQPAPIVETPEELFALDEPPETKSASALAADIRHAEHQGMPVTSHWTDLHAKFAQPAMCAVMIWLAIPFALRLRKGGLAMGFGVSIAIGLIYLILCRVSMGLGHIDRLTPFVAAWLANVVFLVLGLVLFRRTAT